jgi:hypothetical protein
VTLSTSDLFVAGIGFDIAGAVLVAKGLLAAPADQFRRSETIVGLNPAVIASAARDWADAIIGIAALILGFVFQAVGYVLGAVDHDRASGVSAALAEVAIAVGALLAALALWRLIAGRLRLRRAIRIVQAGEFDGSRDVPTTLHRVGQELGFPALIIDHRPETAAAYVLRVFGVDITG